MAYLLPIVLVALGGAGLALVHEDRVVLASLLVQWLGLVWAIAVLGVGALDIFGFDVGSDIEIVTALTCVTVLALRPSLKASGDPGQALVATEDTSSRDGQPASSSVKRYYGQSLQEAHAPHSTGYLLAAAAVLLAGLGGTALALIFPLVQGGEGEQAANLIFYWTALSGALALVLEGTRSPLKLAVGLVALLNAASFLIDTLSVAPPSPAVLGLMAATRIGLIAAISYMWAWLLLQFKDPSLDPLFASREEWMAGPGPEDTGSGVPKQLESPGLQAVPAPAADPRPPSGDGHTPDPQLLESQ